MAAKATGVSQANPSPKEKEVVVKLYRSFHHGMGDSSEVIFNHRMEDYAATHQVTTKYNRIHGSFDARTPGQLRMGFQVKRMAQTNHDLRPVFAIEWADTNGVYPVVFYLVGKKIMKIAGLAGANTVVEVGADALATNATGGMFDDDGSGVPYVYACFGGTSGSAKIRRMNQAQVVTTSADVVAAQLLSLNGKAYRTIQPVGGTAVCQVDVCPYGKDRFTLANWAGATTVGFAGTSINALTAVRQAPVCVKPEGIFVYNLGIDQWVNMTPSWRSFMHLNNGIGAFFLGDKLVVPMGDGGMVMFDGANTRPFDPVPNDATPNIHTTKTKISAMSDLRHWIVAATGGGNDGNAASKLISAGNSLRFLTTTDDAAFTDYSTSIRDLDLNTGADITASATFKIYIGWTRPFTAFHYDTGAPNLVARTMTVKVGTTAPSTYSTQTVVDFTSLAGAPLGQSGDVIFLTDPVDVTGWVPTTVNGITLYWVQLSFSGALTSNVKGWLTCQIQPWHPSIDKTLFPLEGLDKAGCFPHILFGREDPSEQAGQWHDMFSLSRPDLIGALLFSDVGGSGINKTRNLLAIGRFNVWQILTADDDKSNTEEAPILNDVGLLEAAGLAPSAGSLVRLKTLKFIGAHSDPSWKFLFYYKWDSGKKWSKANTELRFPAQQNYFEVNNKGYTFTWAIGWSGTAGEALSQPRLHAIEATFIVLPDDIDSTQERATQTLPVT